jgi:Holliday junction resolvasome RuvABC ATP-dependent DNA helicase subunit
MDERGLDAQQQLYMRKLYKLKAASLATLASLLGSDPDDVAANVEAGLVRLDFVRKGQVGRKLTPAGTAWVKRYLAARKALRQRRCAPTQTQTQSENRGVI